MNEYFCQWLDINNQKIFITISKTKEIVDEIVEFSNTSGKLYIYVFSNGECGSLFTDSFPGLLDDFHKRNVDTHNYCIGSNVKAHEILPEFIKMREEMNDESKVIYKVLNSLNSSA